jgi:hypothetical protein
MRAAAEADVTYISTLEALKGHELCTRDSWVHPITSFDLNSQTFVYQGHPTGVGQVAMEKVVQSRLGD